MTTTDPIKEAEPPLAKLAHDLRNPLSVIRNALQLLQIKGSESPEGKWALDVIDKHTNEMARLIDGLPGARGARTVAAAAPTRRVLIVDDNRLAAMSLSMLLKQSGHDTHCAYDGEEAVAAAAEFKPDVVVLDIGLPRLDGYEAARRIRALPEGGAMLLIALTGWGQDDDKARAEKAGFDHHLVKPVDSAVLTRLLAAAGDPSL